MLIQCIVHLIFGYKLVLLHLFMLKYQYMYKTTHRTSERHTSLVGTCVVIHSLSTRHWAQVWRRDDVIDWTNPRPARTTSHTHIRMTKKMHWGHTHMNELLYTHSTLYLFMGYSHFYHRNVYDQLKDTHIMFMTLNINQHCNIIMVFHTNVNE